jgi:uncharacterized repeat protein (TIGR01451 family)
MNTPKSLALLLLLAAPLAAPGQHVHLPPPPAHGPAPLLYVRFDGPAGVHVTLYEGRAEGRTLPTPCTVGLRPGYIYRVKVGGFPRHPEAILFPTLQVLATLQLPARMRAADYPAPVLFTEEDLAAVGSGTVLTKVAVLEDPERAAPVATAVNQPLETLVDPGQDPLVAARDQGRLLLVVRTGERDFTPEEMARQGIPGTVLFPGDKVLGPPAVPPCFPWTCIPFYDPLLGPRHPEEECLHDGGDVGRPAGLDRDGRLQGLDPSDTVAEYTDSKGRRKIACSNRICICVPRFVIFRAETTLAGFSIRLGPGDTTWVQGRQALWGRVPSVETRQAEYPEGLRGRERLSAANTVQGPARLVRLEVLSAYRMEIGPAELLTTRSVHRLTQVQRTALKKQVEFALSLSQPLGLKGVEQTIGPAVVGRVRGVNVISTVQETRDISCVCKKPVPPPPDKPLVLCKWADRQSARVGDVVTLFIKYTNHGGQPITDVAVSDSLTARLEYVPGSAKSDRDAVFTVEQNEAGSLILRWEITGPLPPAGSGVVSFQVRIR